jgi:predicted transcriptional regulator
MEEFTVELDDEVVTWLEATAESQKKTISEIVSELIREVRVPPPGAERNPG